jgi:hypothetical protein
MACATHGCTTPPHMVQANGLCVTCNKMGTGHSLRQTSKRLDRETFFEDAPSSFVQSDAFEEPQSSCVLQSDAQAGDAAGSHRNSQMELSGVLWKGKRTGLLARFTLRRRFFLLKGRRVQYFKDEKDFKGGKFGPCNPKGSFDVTEGMQRNDLKVP